MSLLEEVLFADTLASKGARTTSVSQAKTTDRLNVDICTHVLTSVSGTSAERQLGDSYTIV